MEGMLANRRLQVILLGGVLVLVTIAASPYSLGHAVDAASVVGPPRGAEDARALASVGPFAVVHPEAAWELNASLLDTTPVDIDGNGRADYLRLHVGLVVDREADYVFQVSMYTGYGGVANAYRALHLPRGNTTVDLDLSGIAISRFDRDGPWDISVNVDREDWPNVQVFDGPWTTPAYTRAEFESRPVARLDVNLTFNPCPASSCQALLEAYDPTNGFVVWASPDTPYTLPLYNGTFEVLIAPGNVAFASIVREVSIQGDEQLAVTINAVPVDSVVQIYDFTILNSTEITTRYTLNGYAPQNRWDADLFGNHDRFANETEITLLEGFDPPFVWGRQMYVAVDGVAMAPGNATFGGVQGADWVSSGEPVTQTAFTRYSLPGPVEANAPHNVAIRLPWYGPYFAATYGIHIPAGTSAVFTHAYPGTLEQLSPSEWRFTAETPSGSYPGITLTLSPQQPSSVPWTVVILIGGVAAATVVATLVLVRRRRPARSSARDQHPPAPPPEEPPSPPGAPP